MSEAGHKILHARANKLRHRPERVLKRLHRSDSFEDANDAQGAIVQHPTDRYDSEDEREQEEERKREEEEARLAEERRARFQAASAAAAATSASRPALPASSSSSSSAAHTSAHSLRAAYESDLAQLAAEQRTTEARLRKIDSKVRQMGQWKTKALATTAGSSSSGPASRAQFNPYDLSNTSSIVELVEGTKLRLYGRLLAATVGRGWARDFRVRRAVNALHKRCDEIVESYMHEHQHAQQQQKKKRHSARSDDEKRNADELDDSDDGEDDDAMPPSPSSSSTAAAVPPASNVILTASSALPGEARAVGGGGTIQGPSVVLQAEVGEWLTQSRNVRRYGRRCGRKPEPLSSHAPATSLSSPSSTAANSAAPTRRSSMVSGVGLVSPLASVTSSPGSSDADPYAATTGARSLSELLLCLADVGPVFRCMLESLLNAAGEGQATLSSFSARVEELQQQVAQQESYMDALDDEADDMERYAGLLLEQVQSLYSEAASLGALAQQHTVYEGRLGRAVAGVQAARERQAIEARKEARRMAGLAHSAANHGATSTGGLGISSTLLAQAQAKAAAAQEAQRAALLRDVIRAQEDSMAAVTKQALQEQARRTASLPLSQQFEERYKGVPKKRTGGAANESEQHAAADGNDLSSQTHHPPGVGELEALLEQHGAHLPTPHLSAFLARKREEVEKHMLNKQGVRPQDLPPDVAPDAGAKQTAASASSSRPSSPRKPAAAAGTRPGSATTTVPRLSSAAMQRTAAAGATHVSPSAIHALAGLPVSSSSGSPPSSLTTLHERLEMHNDASLQAEGTTMAGAVASSKAIADVLAAVPLVAYPPPPTVAPVRAATLSVRAPVLSVADAKPVHLVPTELVGGLSVASRARELLRLADSPYLRTSALTMTQEMEVTRVMLSKPSSSSLTATAAAGEHVAGKTAKTSTTTVAPKKSARGTRPLKAPLQQGGGSASRAPDRPLPHAHLSLGEAATRIQRQKLAQQKFRIEQQLYDKQLFDRE